MAREKCTATKRDGTPCQSFALPGTGLCISHDPERREAQREASRKGGEARANARRAARQWAAIGEEVTASDLPAILRACLFSVKSGAMEPAQASAIATLAKTSVSITNEIELEQRIAALEGAAGVMPDNVRRIA